MKKTAWNIFTTMFSWMQELQEIVRKFHTNILRLTGLISKHEFLKFSMGSYKDFWFFTFNKNG